MKCVWTPHITDFQSSILPPPQQSIPYFLWHCPCCAEEDLLSHLLIWHTNVFPVHVQTFSFLICLHTDHSFLFYMLDPSREEIKQNYIFTLFVVNSPMTLLLTSVPMQRKQSVLAKINPIELDSFRQPGSILPVSCPCAIHKPKRVHARTHSRWRNSLKRFLWGQGRPF